MSSRAASVCFNRFNPRNSTTDDKSPLSNICQETVVVTPDQRTAEREIEFSFSIEQRFCVTPTHVREHPVAHHSSSSSSTTTPSVADQRNQQTKRRSRLIVQPRIEVKVNRGIACSCALPPQCVCVSVCKCVSLKSAGKLNRRRNQQLNLECADGHSS